MIKSAVKNYISGKQIRAKTTPIASTNAERKQIPNKQITPHFDPKRIPYPYRNVIDTLSYIANSTRPDIGLTENGKPNTE